MPTRLSLPIHAGVSDDLDVLVAALAPAPGRRFLSISAHGAGEAALCLASCGADRVLLYDVGDASTLEHLVTVKLTAARLFGREDYLALMGLRPVSRMRQRALVDQLLRALVPAERTFWEPRRRQLLKGLFTSDQVSLFFDVFVGALRVLGSSELKDTIIFGASAEERVAAYREVVDRGWLERALAKVGSRFNLFFPKAEWNASTYPRELNRDPLRYLEGLVVAGLADNPLFAHHFRTGSPIPEDLLPPHLRPGCFDGLRSAAPKVRVVRTRPNEALPLQDATSGFSGAYLSNTIDYLTPPQRRSLFDALVEQLAPGARVLIYSNEEWEKVPDDERLTRDEEASAMLAEKDRAKIYRRVSLYRIAGEEAMSDEAARTTRLRVVR